MSAEEITPRKVKPAKAVRFVPYDTFPRVLEYGSQSVVYQLNVPDASSTDPYACTPLCDGGRTMDRALRLARDRVNRKRPVILVTAQTLVPYDSDEETVSFGIVCEIILH